MSDEETHRFNMLAQLGQLISLAAHVEYLVAQVLIEDGVARREARRKSMEDAIGAIFDRADAGGSESLVNAAAELRRLNALHLFRLRNDLVHGRIDHHKNGVGIHVTRIYRNDEAVMQFVHNSALHQAIKRMFALTLLLRDCCGPQARGVYGEWPAADYTHRD